MLTSDNLLITYLDAIQSFNIYCTLVSVFSSASGACKPLAAPTDGQINCGDSTIF